MQLQNTYEDRRRKSRLVVDLIRGKNVSDALTILRFTKKRICRDVEKVLKSAVANAEQKTEGRRCGQSVCEPGLRQ